MEQTFAITVTDEPEDNVIKAIDLTTLDGTTGFLFSGIDRRDASGYSVSSAGDVNGDDDLIVGVMIYESMSRDFSAVSRRTIIANMVEVLVREHCDRNGVAIPGSG